MKRVLYDTNVVLDVLLKRQPYFAVSALAIDPVGQGKVEGYISAHAVTTLAYLLQRHLSAAESREVLVNLLSKMQVAPVTDAIIREALGSVFKDFEDAVTHAAASAVGAIAIVSRNVRDFASSRVPAVLPEVFIASNQD
jgi:predicted nucleic acid-binding protein